MNTNDIIFYSAAFSALFLAAMVLVTGFLAPARALSRRHSHGFHELLEYLYDLGSGVVMLKGGALMSVFEVTPLLSSALTAEDLQGSRERLSQALLRLEGGWSVHFDAVRRKNHDYSVEHYQGPESAAALEQGRERALCESGYYSTSLYMTLCQSLSRHDAVRLLKNPAAAGLDKAVTEFRRRLIILQSGISMAVRLRRLSGTVAPLGCSEELLSFITEAVYGKQRSVRQPEENARLDYQLSVEDFQTGYTPVLGKDSLGLVAVEALPSELTFSMLSALAHLNFESRFSTRFICHDSLRTSLMLKRKKRLWEQRRVGLLSQILNLQSRSENHDALRQVEDVEQASEALSSHEEIFGAYSAVMVLRDSSAEHLSFKVEQTVRAIERCGLSSRVETFNSVESYLGSLPGQCRYNVRRPLISHKHLGDLLPLTAAFAGESTSPNPFFRTGSTPPGALFEGRTEDGGRFLLNLHDGDLGNTIVLGPPGSGKSVLLCTIIRNVLRYKGMQVFAFERGRSLQGLCRALGGAHVDFERDTPQLCPLYHLDNSSDIGRAQRFLELLCTLNVPHSGAALNEDIAAVLSILALRPGSQRTLTDAHMLAGTETLKQALEPYMRLDRREALLDGSADLPLDNRVCVFECADVLDQDLRFQLPLLQHLFNLIERCIDGQHPVCIVLDEAWMMLKDQAFATRLITWFKTLRKSNAFVVLATQSLGDLNSEAGEAISDCAKTRIYLPNNAAQSEPLRSCYLNAGLNEENLRDLSLAVPKRDYFLHKSGNFCKFELQLTQEELEVFTSSCVALQQTKQVLQQKISGADEDSPAQIAGEQGAPGFGTAGTEENQNAQEPLDDEFWPPLCRAGGDEDSPGFESSAAA